MNSASFTQQFPGQTAATDAAARFWDATRIVVSTLLSTREYMAQFHQVEADDAPCPPPGKLPAGAGRRHPPAGDRPDPLSLTAVRRPGSRALHLIPRCVAHRATRPVKVLLTVIVATDFDLLKASTVGHRQDQVVHPSDIRNEARPRRRALLEGGVAA